MKAGRCITGLALGVAAAGAAAQTASYKKTDSRQPYVHRIELFDASDRRIDPQDAQAPPYSPLHTCKKCHDVGAVARGHHFNAATAGAGGRAGEPWILTERRTATEIPLSYRGFPGTWRPEALGLTPLRFVQEFGRHLPGGAASYAGADETTGRWRLSGALAIDCMICHAAGNTYSLEVRAKEIEQQNFAWAPTAALGLAKIEGAVKPLPDDVDPAAAEGAARLPKARYAASVFDAEGRVFFDIVRRPASSACYACHTTRVVADGTVPSWNHDGDVHLRAGMACADCHRNGIEHHIVRGFEGEQHPQGVKVASLTCRGCHLGDEEGGRLGAPKPEHRGLPVLHLEKLACTSCHSGPGPSPHVPAVQTSRAHGLGLPSQTRTDADPPPIAAPLQRKDADGIVRPYHVTWPSYWGWLREGSVLPMDPAVAYRTLRRALRVRADLVAELAPDGSASALRGAITKGLAAFAAAPEAGAVPVFVAGGKAYRLDRGGTDLEVFTHPAAEPYVWPLAHDVRPARHATGAGGCTDCHAKDAAWLYATLTPRGPLPEAASPMPMHALLGQTEPLRSFWELAFQGRSAFKWIGFLAVLCVLLVLLLHLLLGLDGLGRWLARRPRRGAE